MVDHGTGVGRCPIFAVPEVKKSIKNSVLLTGSLKNAGFYLVFKMRKTNELVSKAI
jgi:hypothetical protein